jgi:hypothetical protein
VRYLEQPVIEKSQVKKTKKPKIAGLLTVGCGVLGMFGAATYTYGLGNIPLLGKGDVPPFVPSIIFGVPMISVLVGLVAVLGGVLAMTRTRWGWCMGGAVAGSLSFLPLGVAAMALMAMSKEEFG